MKKNYTFGGMCLLYILIFCTSFSVLAQVGIGNTNPDPSALLHIDDGSGKKGLLIPKVNLTNLNNPGPVTNPAQGLAVYNTNVLTGGPGYFTWTGSKWTTFYEPKNWSLSGNSSTVPGIGPSDNFLGTRDSRDLVFATKRLERLRIMQNYQIQAGGNGQASIPFYSWKGSPSSGIFLADTNVVAFATAGVERLRIANGHQIQGAANGTAAAPFYSWVSNPNMGMYGAGVNALAFSTDSAERMRLLSSGQIAINRTTAMGTSRLTVWEIDANTAIYGRSVDGEGIRGEVSSNGNGDGVVGIALAGRGLYGQSTSGSGVSGVASANGGKAGYFSATHSNGVGLLVGGGGLAAQAFNNSGTGASITGRLYGITSFAAAINGLGIAGIGNNMNSLPTRPQGVGVLGYGNQAGVFGTSDELGQTGVFGKATGDLGAGVYGENTSGAGYGVQGNSNNIGVRGTGLTGGQFISNNNAGYGAMILNTATSGVDRIGLVVSGQNGASMLLSGTGATFNGSLRGGAGFAATTTGTGLIGVGNNISSFLLASNGSGVAGTGTAVGSFGHAAQSSNGVGVVGVGNDLSTYSTPTVGAGVAGTGTDIGVYGKAVNSAGYGVYSDGNIYAGGTITTVGGFSSNGNIVATGDIQANTNITVGSTLTSGNILSTTLNVSGAKNFIIDDPRDPENKFLKHASIESNEILNLYRGVQTFDENGHAIVQLPDYYEAINKNASYTLTPIGASMPNLYILREVANGEFEIAGGVAGKKVAWTIMAERNDPFLQHNPEERNMVVDKGAERGLYLAPEAYGKGADKSIFKNRLIKDQPDLSNGAAKTVSSQQMHTETVEARKLDIQDQTTASSRLIEDEGQKIIKAEVSKDTPKVLEPNSKNEITNPE